MVLMVCIGFLRTQQRAKSQCIKHNLVNAPLCLCGMVRVRLFLPWTVPACLAGALLSWLQGLAVLSGAVVMDLQRRV